MGKLKTYFENRSLKRQLKSAMEEIEDIKLNHAKEIKSLQLSHKTALSDLTIEKESEKRTEIDTLKSKHREKLSQIKNDYEFRLSEETARVNLELKRIERSRINQEKNEAESFEVRQHLLNILSSVKAVKTGFVQKKKQALTEIAGSIDILNDLDEYIHMSMTGEKVSPAVVTSLNKLIN